MKAVLISIRPEWCAKIASGEKTIEVRKTRPKLTEPFKCYIYRTLPKSGDWCEKDGKVIGEFVCDRIDRYNDEVVNASSLENFCGWNDFDLNRACMHPDDLEKYADGKELYGWHISNLKIYDTPKKLSEFEGLQKTRFGYAPYKITRPPQSFCYVEELT